MKYFLIFLLALSLHGCGEPIKQPQGMLSEDLECPPGSHGEITRWGVMGENGWAHSCKMQHGKYHVWRNEVLVIEGAFLLGKKEGTWTWRDKDGNVTRIIEYKGGEEVQGEGGAS